MEQLTKELARIRLNALGAANQPFFFLSDFTAENFTIFNVRDFQDKVFFNFDPTPKSNSNSNSKKADPKEVKLSVKDNLDYKLYEEKFDLVQKELKFGNSYLVNLTFAVPCCTHNKLEDFFHSAAAKYLIYLPDNFVCFSPETFIKIETVANETIVRTYPMKGTFAKGAEQESLKERAEHATIVDLLRNDLSEVAKNVKVKDYRFSTQINTTSGEQLIQHSSEIVGTLSNNYHHKLGDIITSLLPAGSVTGAPKDETVRIIKEVENYSRGFYTGVAGYFDGTSFDSCVLIRFLEKSHEDYLFKAGGGITTESDCLSEYQELLSKIYVPVA